MAPIPDTETAQAAGVGVTGAAVDRSAPGVDRSAAAVDPDGEYRILVEGCGLLDRSDRGKLALTGAGAVEFLNGQVTNELADLHPGEGCYAAFLTHKGKMLGDLRILAAGDQGPAGAVEPVELLLDTERVALQALFDMIRRFKVGFDVQLHKRTLETTLLSLIGPDTDAVLVRATDGSLPDQVEHAHRNAPIAGRPVRIVRTAAPAGVDVMCDAADREAVEGALLSADAQPVSEAAAEIVRIEHGRPRYGIDLDDTVIPQEADLNDRAVSFTKGCYVGQETVARLHYRGKPNRRLVGLRLSAPSVPDDEVHLGERLVGRLGSVAVSPRFGPIALALIRREAELGTSLRVGEGAITAEVIGLPFEGPFEN